MAFYMFLISHISFPIAFIISATALRINAILEILKTNSSFSMFNKKLVFKEHEV